MKILTSDSVETLRTAVRDNGLLLPQIELGELEKDYKLDYVEVNYGINNAEIKLDIPKIIAERSPTDKINSIRIWEVMKNITANQATDERLWLTLCLNQQRVYAQARWKNEEKDKNKQAAYILNHWFAKTSRIRLRDNAISRLWWMAKIADRLSCWRSMEEALDVLFSKADLRVQLLDRTSSANASEVVDAVLEVIKQAEEKHETSYDRQAFRDFMVEMSFMGKRTALASHERDELVAVLLPQYLGHHAHQSTST